VAIKIKHALLTNKGFLMKGCTYDLNSC